MMIENYHWEATCAKDKEQERCSIIFWGEVGRQGLRNRESSLELSGDVFWLTRINALWVCGVLEISLELSGESQGVFRRCLWSSLEQ